MIVHQLPTITFELDEVEADEAFRLMELVNQLGDELCGSPQHHEAMQAFSAFIGKVALDNLARGSTKSWLWSPHWHMVPAEPPPTIGLWEMYWMLTKELFRLLASFFGDKQPTTPPTPARAEVVPIRRK